MGKLVTRSTKQELAKFIECSLPRLTRYVDKVANGVPKRNKATGELILDSDGAIQYHVKPDYAKAAALVLAACEYTTPKLSRAEVKQETIISLDSVTHDDLRTLTREQLLRLKFEAENINNQPQELPEWLR